MEQIEFEKFIPLKTEKKNDEDILPTKAELRTELQSKYRSVKYSGRARGFFVK